MTDNAEKDARCDMCPHPSHHPDDCEGIVGYDHLNGDHFCGCAGSLGSQLAQARAEALEVAALMLSKVVDYWDGRPVTMHGQHIYADLRDVLAGIEADAAHNRNYSTGSTEATS